MHSSDQNQKSHYTPTVFFMKYLLVFINFLFFLCQNVKIVWKWSVCLFTT